MDYEKETLKDTAFYNLQKNLDIEYVKTGEKDWFHSGYRLLDYWITKEKIEEFKLLVIEHINNEEMYGEEEFIRDLNKVLGNFTSDTKGE